MAVPAGAIVNTAVSLISATENPSVSNVVGLTTDAVAIFNNSEANITAQAAAPLVSSLANTLIGGSPFNALNVSNQAVRLAQGFLDPETASIVGSVSSGLNQIFGAGGILNPIGISGSSGNKPIGLRTETMATQPMKSAYSPGQDVAFSFVRAGSALEAATAGPLDEGGASPFNADGNPASAAFGGTGKRYADGSILGSPTPPSSALEKDFLSQGSAESTSFNTDFKL